MYADEHAGPIPFRIYKSRRVMRSVPAAELIALAAVFDEEFLVEDPIEMAITNSAKLNVLTDSKRFLI